LSQPDRVPLIRVTAMPADTNPYGGVFGGWLMGQMGLACGSFASRRTRGKAILVAADQIKFPGAMAVGDELSVYVELLKQGRTSLRLKAEALARERDGDKENVVAEGEFTFVASARGPAAMSPRSGRRNSASRPRSSSARIWAVSASTGAASRPRRSCGLRKSSIT
jgi:acyl-CoA thioesterase YciA